MESVRYKNIVFIRLPFLDHKKQDVHKIAFQDRKRSFIEKAHIAQ